MDEFVSTKPITQAVSKALKKPTAKPLTAERLQPQNPIMSGANRIIGYAWTAPQLLGMLGGLGGFIGGKPVEEGQTPTTRQKIGGAMKKPAEFLAKPTSEVINADIISGVASGVGKLQEFFGKITGAPARADRNAAEIKNKLGQIGSIAGLSSGVQSHLVTARDALAANNAEAYHTAFEAAQTALQAEKKQGAGFFKSLTSGEIGEWNARRKHNGALEKAYKKATLPMNQSAMADAEAEFWKNPVEGVKNRLANQSLQATVYDAARYGSIAMQYYGQVRETRASYSTLKQLYADLTGVKAKEVGFFTLVKGYFSGSTPAFLKNAIGSYFKNTFLGFGFLTAGTVAQEKVYSEINKRGGSGMQAMLGSMAIMQGLSFAENRLSKPNMAVSLYENLRNMQAENMTILAGRAPDLPADYPTQPNYADLIVAAVPSLQSNSSFYTKEVVLVARYFEAYQTPIADAMKVLAGGKDAVIKLSETAYNELVVQPKQAEEAAAKAPVTTTEKKEVPAFLQQKTERSILGKHTANLAKAPAPLQHHK